MRIYGQRAPKVKVRGQWVEVADPEPPAADLNDLTRAELNDYAIDLGLDPAQYKNKRQLLAAIDQTLSL